MHQSLPSATEINDADTWTADYGVVYHLKENPAGTAPQAEDSTANAVHGSYDVAGATIEDNALWGGRCILFDNGPRLRVDDNPAIEDADRITIEAWVNTLSWPGRAVVCRKEGSYILYNFSGGFSWYLFGPDNRLQHDIAGTLGNGSWGYSRHLRQGRRPRQPAPLPQRHPRRADERYAAPGSQCESPRHRTACERHRRTATSTSFASRTSSAPTAGSRPP